ncbi:WhiB family transcriptional regulator [Streptomyces sp. NPDC001978]|uniref:WhiB family transcriptional regulator n=1 Tax=Streptomyces sp. NPDC001978 TaxID=3364627 RepID=UPI0036A997B9
MKPLNVRPLLSEWSWQSQAACRGMDSSVFFSPSGERGADRHRRQQRAQSICGTCPVRRPCATFAVRTGQAHGVWGGLTESERETGAQGR